MPPDAAGVSPADVVAETLSRRGWTLATAESCTGGLLGKTITDRPGSSAFYAGGVIAYANEIKVSQLGVSPEDLAAHGAVSESVAAQMADGVRDRFASDVALSVTGVAGPGGGTDQKPVGTVWMAVRHPGSPGGGLQIKRTFDGGRDQIRRESVEFLIDALAKSLQGGRRV
ncbi:MAG: CinA family protein [Longimicrobiales bacterium]